jgi:hypothetical protein
MSYPIKYPTPQGANIQIFNGGNQLNVANHVYTREWVKPQGASFVWFTLIGGGGGGGNDDGSNIAGGGGSGGVSNFMCPAFLIPNVLNVVVGTGGAAASSGINTIVSYRQKDTAEYTLLVAGGGGAGGSTTAGSGGTARAANNFTAMGFYQSVAGQDGNVGTASATTFLSGGAGGGVSTTVVANYGYGGTTNSNPNGYFQMQPIIVGQGGSTKATSHNNASNGIGCGGAGADLGSGFPGGRGGDGMVVIITW